MLLFNSHSYITYSLTLSVIIISDFLVSSPNRPHSHHGWLEDWNLRMLQRLQAVHHGILLSLHCVWTNCRKGIVHYKGTLWQKISGDFMYFTLPPFFYNITLYVHIVLCDRGYNVSDYIFPICKSKCIIYYDMSIIWAILVAHFISLIPL